MSFNEKKEFSKSGKINAGVYLIDKKFYEKMDQTKKSIEIDIFPRLINSGLYAFNVGKKFIDIGTPTSLIEAADYFEQRLTNDNQ
jgi:NDP-sugar pyrophosphorylase family protein